MSVQTLNLHELNPQLDSDFLPEFGTQRWSPDYIRFLQSLTFFRGLLQPVTFTIIPPYVVRVSDIVFGQDGVLGHWKGTGTHAAHYHDFDLLTPTDYRGQDVYLWMSYAYGVVYADPTFGVTPITQSIEDFESANPTKFVVLKVRVPLSSALPGGAAEIGPIVAPNVNAWDVSMAKPVASRLFQEYYNTESYASTSSDGILKSVGQAFDLNYTPAGRLFGIKAGLARMGTQWMRLVAESQVVVPNGSANKKAGVFFGYSSNGLIRVYTSNAVPTAGAPYVEDIPAMFPTSYPAGFTPLWYAEVVYDVTGVPTLIPGSKRDLRQYSYPAANGHRPGAVNDPVATAFVDSLHPLVPLTPVVERAKIVLDTLALVTNLSEGSDADRSELQLGEGLPVTDRAMKVMFDNSGPTRLEYKYDIYSLNSVRVFFRAKTAIPGIAKMSIGVRLYDSVGALIFDNPILKQYLALPAQFAEFDTLIDPQIYYQATPLSAKQYAAYYRLYIDFENDGGYVQPNYVYVHDFRVGSFVGNAEPTGIRTEFAVSPVEVTPGRWVHTFNHNLGTRAYFVFAYLDNGVGAGDEQISPRVYNRGLNTCDLEFDAPYTNIKVVAVGGAFSGVPRIIDLDGAVPLTSGFYLGMDKMVPVISEFDETLRFTDSPVFKGMTIVDPTSIGGTPHYYLQTWQSGNHRELQLGDASPNHDVVTRILGDLVVDGAFTKVAQDVLVGSSLLKLNGTSPLNLDSSFESKWLDDPSANPDRVVSAFNATTNEITMASGSHGLAAGQFFDIQGATTALNDGNYRVASGYVSGAVIPVVASWKAVDTTEPGLAGTRAYKEFNPSLRWAAATQRWELRGTALVVPSLFGQALLWVDGPAVFTYGIFDTSIKLTTGKELRSNDDMVMADATGRFLRLGSLGANAVLRSCTINVTSGAITDGPGPDLYMNYGVLDATPRGQFQADRVWGAVWADFADFQRLASGESGAVGRCFVQTKGGLQMASRRCQAGAVGIHSDTFAHAAGVPTQTSEAYNSIPIGVSGWVLAFVDKVYAPGTPLVSNAQGGLTRASLLERLLWSHRIIGTYSRPEPKARYGTAVHQIEVQGRHWVRV